MVERGRNRHKSESPAIVSLEKSLTKLPKHQTCGAIAAGVSALKASGIDLQIEAPEQFVKAAAKALQGRDDRDEIILKLSTTVSGHIAVLKGECESDTPQHTVIAAILNAKRLLYKVSIDGTKLSRLEQVGALEDAFYCLSLANASCGKAFADRLGVIAWQIVGDLLARECLDKAESLIENLQLPGIPRAVFTEMLQKVCEAPAASLEGINKFLDRYRTKIDNSLAHREVRPQIEYFVMNIDKFSGPNPAPDMQCPSNWPKLLWRIYCFVCADRAIQNGDQALGEKIATLALPRLRGASSYGVGNGGPNYNHNDLADCEAIYNTICSRNPQSFGSGIGLLTQRVPFSRIFPAASPNSGYLRYKTPPAKVLSDVFGLEDIPIIGGWPSSNRVVEYLIKLENIDDLLVPDSMKGAVNRILSEFQRRDPDALLSLGEALDQFKERPRLYFYLGYLLLSIHIPVSAEATIGLVPQLFPDPADRLFLLTALEGDRQPIGLSLSSKMIAETFKDIPAEMFDRAIDVVGVLSESLATLLAESADRYSRAQSRMPSPELEKIMVAPMEAGKQLEHQSPVHLFGALVVSEALTAAEVEELKVRFSESDFLPIGHGVARNSFEELQTRINLVLPSVILVIVDPTKSSSSQPPPIAMGKIGTLWLPRTSRLIMSRAFAYQLAGMSENNFSSVIKWLVNLSSCNLEGALSAQLAIQAEIFRRGDIGRLDPYFGGALLPTIAYAKFGNSWVLSSAIDSASPRPQVIMLGAPEFLVRESLFDLQVLFAPTPKSTTGKTVRSLGLARAHFSSCARGFSQTFHDRITVNPRLDCPVAANLYYSKDIGAPGLHIHPSLLSLELRDLQSLLEFFVLENHSQNIARTSTGLRPEISKRLKLCAALKLHNDSHPESALGYTRLVSAFNALGSIGWDVSYYLRVFATLQESSRFTEPQPIFAGELAARCCQDLNPNQEESGGLWAIYVQKHSELSALSSSRVLVEDVTRWPRSLPDAGAVDGTATTRSIFDYLFPSSALEDGQDLFRKFNALCMWTDPMSTFRALVEIGQISHRARLLACVSDAANSDIQPLRNIAPPTSRAKTDLIPSIERRIAPERSLSMLSMRGANGHFASKGLLTPSITAYDLWSLGYHADSKVMEAGRDLAATLAKLHEDPVIGLAAKALLCAFVERHGQIYGLLRADIPAKVVDSLKPALRVALTYSRARAKTGIVGDQHMAKLVRTVEEDLESLINFGRFPIAELEKFGLMSEWDGRSISAYILDRAAAAASKDKERYCEELARKVSGGAEVSPTVIPVVAVLLPHATPALQAQLLHDLSLSSVPKPLEDWLRTLSDSSISDLSGALVQAHDRYLRLVNKLPEDLKVRVISLTPPSSLEALIKDQDTDAVRSIIHYRKLVSGEVDSQATKAENARLREQYESHVSGLPTELPNLLAGSGKIDNWYVILGVPRNSNHEIISASFRKLSMIYHPDRFNSESEDEKRRGNARFQKIKSAGDVLKDGAPGGKRAQFDRSVTRRPDSFPSKSWLD